MRWLTRFTFSGILATMIVACSEKVTDPKKMVEMAAKHKDPYGELERLYAISVLPEPKVTDDAMAWHMVQYFTKETLNIKRPGILIDTVEFPEYYEVEIKEEPASIEIATGKPLRSYLTLGYFHAKNRYGIKTRFNVSMRFRTDMKEKWEIFTVVIEDPSRPMASSFLVSEERDIWDGYEILSAPDSLRTQLEALLAANPKQN